LIIKKKGEDYPLVTHHFQIPHPAVSDTHIIYISFLFMLAKHVYPRIHNGWTIIQLIVEMHRDEVDQASKDDYVCDAYLEPITLCDPKRGNQIIPLDEIAPVIYQKLTRIQDFYNTYKVPELVITIFSTARKPSDSVVIQTDQQVLYDLNNKGILHHSLNNTFHNTLQQVKQILHNNHTIKQQQKLDITNHLNPNPLVKEEGTIKTVARHEFHEPFPRGNETHKLFQGIMFLLLKLGYPRIDTGNHGWVRVTPALEILKGEYNCNENDRFYRPISKSISLRSHDDAKIIPIEVIGNTIFRLLIQLGEDYQFHKIVAVHLNIYSSNRMPKADIILPSDEKVFSQLHEISIISDSLTHIMEKFPINPKRVGYNTNSLNYITMLTNQNHVQMDQFLQKLADNPKWNGTPNKLISVCIWDIHPVLNIIVIIHTEYR
jgi:hypothetical protein